MSKFLQVLRCRPKRPLPPFGNLGNNDASLLFGWIAKQSQASESHVWRFTRLHIGLLFGVGNYRDRSCRSRWFAGGVRDGTADTVAARVDGQMETHSWILWPSTPMARVKRFWPNPPFYSGHPVRGLSLRVNACPRVSRFLAGARIASPWAGMRTHLRRWRTPMTTVPNEIVVLVLVLSAAVLVFEVDGARGQQGDDSKKRPSTESGMRSVTAAKKQKPNWQQPSGSNPPLA